MAVTFAVGFRTCCVAMGLFVASARAAEPVSPLLGITRDQLISRYGEPRSQIAAGNRIIYYYPRETIVLRNNVVVEVEQFAVEGGTSTPPPSAPPPNEPTTQSTSPAPEPKLEIKSVRSPSSKDSRPPTPEPTKSAPVVPQPVPPTPPRVVPETVPPATSIPADPPPVVTKKAEPVEQPLSEEAVTPVPKVDAAAEKSAADELAKKKKEDALRAERVKAEQAQTPPPGGIFSNPTYILVLVLAVGGAGFLIWRSRQRQLDLAASSVENTPLEAASTAPKIVGNGFTAELLNKLDWKRFEELVTAYYSKTGVVAARTNAGVDSPVHIKISWKGEPRPFAYVKCIAHPAGLIDPKPLQALLAALAADDIRRGYIVTTGKFNVAARDLGEEKHLTLLPGEIFLEKLNALPAAARTDIMQAISGGDRAVSS